MKKITRRSMLKGSAVAAAALALSACGRLQLQHRFLRQHCCIRSRHSCR